MFSFPRCTMLDRVLGRVRLFPRAATGLALLVAGVVLGGCWAYTSPEAQQRWQARGERFTVTVFPVRVIRGPRMSTSGSCLK